MAAHNVRVVIRGIKNAFIFNSLRQLCLLKYAKISITHSVLYSNILCNEWNGRQTDYWRNWVSPWHAHRANISRIVFEGPITAGTSLSGLFADLTYLADIEGLEYFDTSDVTDMSGMFSSSIFEPTSLDISHFDTGNVTTMKWSQGP
ncbi:MAG: BspA family leucine-rich repeat surface protein [Oscillospiraceae bacterium]|nr:BspA family leucine-rich repeat surface protein [Oscillospiraceae bacterium]